MGFPHSGLRRDFLKEWNSIALMSFINPDEGGTSGESQDARVMRFPNTDVRGTSGDSEIWTYEFSLPRMKTGLPA